MESTGPTDLLRGSGGPARPTGPGDRVRPGTPDGAAPEPPTAGPDRPPPDIPGGPAEPPAPLRHASRVGAAVLVVVALIHVFLLFLHVAPANQLSQRYARQIQGWVYPFFEQNWRLFAPDPESAQPQVSVRAVRTSAGGARQVGDWLDLTAIDNAAVRHDPFPSHTAQNMLRRAWTGYLESHGTGDIAYSDRAVMWQEYLRNIAVDRLTAARPGTYAGIQLRVRTTPVAGYDATGHRLRTPPTAVQTRVLPWWKVTSHDH
ncbi:DUF5819 family protein [Actinacidiphila sp. ITFR-21]|uniref:DUF5819 family protein n=1 Tax=Actinacidiphila sp. ITFR-21 TaxID=3075199 RepID=UPI002889CE4A|nr:DUF5819 family protein [Streptomyces sp. ITFR-21]WNI16109.1 DUF5819 family protein [Streptomyces sp. ITFR-21]